MIEQSELLLIGAVAAVGVLHTIVPDHWVPITLIARQQGWRRPEVVRAALVAGTGHTVSTLLIGLVVWIAGVAFATRFGNLVSLVSSVALVAFGLWIAISSLREIGTGHGHAHELGATHVDDDDAHAASHRHPHHEHDEHDVGTVDMRLAQSRAGNALLTQRPHPHAAPGGHEHRHDDDLDTWLRESVVPAGESGRAHPQKRPLRTTLLLILGSSPMVEGIPAFFAAGKYGPGLIAVMAVVFAIATIGTYVTLCVASVAGLRYVRFGALERYGEVLSGAFIALVGFVFLFFPIY